jgi:hypothetical protein
MKIAAQLLAPYGRYLASVKPSQVDLATSNHGEGHKASRSKDQGLWSKLRLVGGFVYASLISTFVSPPPGPPAARGGTRDGRGHPRGRGGARRGQGLAMPKCWCPRDREEGRPEPGWALGWVISVTPPTAHPGRPFRDQEHLAASRPCRESLRDQRLTEDANEIRSLPIPTKIPPATPDRALIRWNALQ